MSRLTELDKPPKLRKGAAAPHQYRLLGDRVLITDELGRWALLSRAEHARLLAGLKTSDPLWPTLQSRGFVAGAFDFDAASRRKFERSLLSWKGPGEHVLLVDGMDLDTARAVVEFVFACPGPQLTLELVFNDASACWPVLWYVVQHARRKGEWSRRPVFLIARGKTMTPDQADYFRSHGVTRSLELSLDGAPDMKKAPAFKAQRARALLKSATQPRAWAQWFEKWGFESVRLIPGTLDAKSAEDAVAFYGEFLGWLVEHGEEANLRDEWTLGFLGGRLWNLPGMDVLEQLAYDAKGRVFPSEEAARGEGELCLGAAGTLRYADIAARPATRAVIAAGHPDNQPLCAQCAYRPYCAVPASLNQKLQGTLWGSTPESHACALQMGILDHIFGRLDDEKWLLLLDKWHVDMT